MHVCKTDVYQEAVHLLLSIDRVLFALRNWSSAEAKKLHLKDVFTTSLDEISVNSRYPQYADVYTR